MNWKKRDFRTRTSYLDYYKVILERVSFCKDLFKKEYHKARNTIHPKELPHLNEWLKAKQLLKHLSSSNKK